MPAEPPPLSGPGLEALVEWTATANGRAWLWERIRILYRVEERLDHLGDLSTVSKEPPPFRPWPGRPPRERAPLFPAPPPGEEASAAADLAHRCRQPGGLEEQVWRLRQRSGPRSPFVSWNTGARLPEGDRGGWHGLPVAVKDDLHVPGMVTGAGTGYRRTPVRSRARVVAALAAAGAVVVAKTHTTEWGMDAAGRNPHLSLPRNPLDPSRAAGGSSTGSAVAVARGLLPLTVGSDAGGSVRIPASCCGILGLKPTFGRVPLEGSLLEGSTMGAIGPLARSCADLAAFLGLFGGGAALERGLRAGVRGLRIGVPEDLWEKAPLAARRAAGYLIEALTAEGARFESLRAPWLDAAPALGPLVLGRRARAALGVEQARAGPRIGADLRLVLRGFEAVPPAVSARARRGRVVLQRRVAMLFRRLDLLLLPSTSRDPPLHPRAEDGVAVCDDAAARGLCRYQFLANLCGLPAGTQPVPRGETLPPSVQWVGDVGDDATVLAAMAHCERLGLARAVTGGPAPVKGPRRG